MLWLACFQHRRAHMPGRAICHADLPLQLRLMHRKRMESQVMAQTSQLIWKQQHWIGYFRVLFDNAAHVLLLVISQHRHVFMQRLMLCSLPEACAPRLQRRTQPACQLHTRSSSGSLIGAANMLLDAKMLHFMGAQDVGAFAWTPHFSVGSISSRY
jgi:hypothetical protein